jgi:hypothetical protein
MNTFYHGDAIKEARLAISKGKAQPKEGTYTTHSSMAFLFAAASE